MIIRPGAFLTSTIGTGEGSSFARLLARDEPDVVAWDFRDCSLVVRDSATPANNFSGNVNSWFTNSAPTTWLLGANGLYTSGTTLRTEYSAAGEPLGHRSDPTATNLFLNSRTPVTQTVTTTGTSYTISGVGAVGATLTLSGTGTGTLTGTGALDRDQLTVVCTAGSLTITVDGVWDFVNVEAGTFATAPIVTLGTSVTRAASVVTKLITAMPYNAATGTLFADFSSASADLTVSTSTYFGASFNNASTSNYIALYRYRDTVRPEIITGGVTQASTARTVVTGPHEFHRVAVAYATNDIQGSVDGTLTSADASATLPTVTRLEFGVNSVRQTGGHMKRGKYVPRRVSNSDLPTFGGVA